MTIQLEDVACPLGCTKGDEFILSADDRLHGFPGHFRVVRCRECGLMRTSPRPTPEAISKFYPADYEPFRYTRASTQQTGQSKRPYWKRVAKTLFDPRSMHIPELAPGAFLEVGCASGAYLDYMHSKGWTVQGLEPNPVAADFARQRGFRVETGTLNGGTSFPAKYDLIVGWMVMEHLHDLIGGLKSLKAHANKHAYLCFSIPNAGSLEFRLFKDRWFALQVPTHLFHFSPHSITRVLEAAGWSVERIFPHRSLAIAAASLSYYADDLGLHATAKLIRERSHSRSLVYGTAPLAHAVAALAGTGAMTVWARA